MNKFILIIIISVLTLFSCKKDKSQSTEQAVFDKQQMLKCIYNNYILVKIQDFKIKIQELDNMVDVFNNSPSLENLENIRNSWKIASRVFKESNVYNIGVIKNTYSYPRIETRPANNIFIENNIDTSSVIHNSYFDNIGFSSKGLGCIEYLIFHNTDSVIINEFSNNIRKSYLKGAINDIQKNISIISETWSNIYYNRFYTYTSHGIESSINILVNRFVEVVEKIYQDKLGKPLGKKDNVIDFNKTEASLSEESINFIKYELNAIESAFNNGFYSYLDAMNLNKGNNKLSQSIKDKIQDIKSKISSISSLEQDIISGANNSEQLYNKFRDLLVLLKVDVVSGLNIIIVINDNDGD